MPGRANKNKRTVRKNKLLFPSKPKPANDLSLLEELKKSGILTDEGSINTNICTENDLVNLLTSLRDKKIIDHKSMYNFNDDVD